MSEIAQDGWLALAVQTAKGTPATVSGTDALRLTSNSLSGSSEMLDFEEEIGGGRDATTSSAVMGGFTVSGEFEGLFRPKAFGLLLLAAGFSAAAPVQDGVTGAWTHTFTPATSAKYLSLLTRWGNTDAIRRFSDVLVDELTLSLEANGKATFSASLIGRREEYGQSAVVPTFETSPVANYAGSAVTLDALGTYRWESMELAIANNLSDDEFVIGSRGLDDVTPGAREVTFGGTIKVGNNSPSVTNLYRAAVLGSKTATDSDTAGADPYVTSAAMTFGSKKLIGTSVTKRFGLIATIPEATIAGFPLEASGADRLTVDLECRALKGSGAVVSIDLQNDRGTQYV